MRKVRVISALGTAAICVCVAGVILGRSPLRPQLEPWSRRVSALPKTTVVEPGLASSNSGEGEETESRDIPEGARAPLPDVLRGTDVDGALHVDETGHFSPDASARSLFDYFFLASGLESDDVIRGRIALQIEKRLEPPADSEALAVLSAYMDLRSRVRELGRKASTQPTDPRDQLDRIRELRHATLGVEVADSMFAEEERVIEIELDRRAILQDQSLTSEQRARRLAVLEEDLPVEIRAARVASEVPLRALGYVASLRAQGAPEAEIFAYREEQFGREAAQRLAAADQEEVRWESAWRAYQSERDALLANRSLSESDRIRSLDRLRRTLFQEGDIPRVQAIENLEE